MIQWLRANAVFSFIFFIIFAMLCVGIVASGVWKKPAPIKEVIPVLKPHSELMLIEWVYKHSNRISMDGCKKIVKSAMETRKPLLILAIMDIESNFVPTATSPKNAMGLMQVMPGVWDKDLIKNGIIKERRDLYDIEPAIKAGDYVLNYCLNQSKGDVEKALELYLGGKDQWYVKKIFANLANLYLITETKLQ